MNSFDKSASTATSNETGGVAFHEDLRGEHGIHIFQFGDSRVAAISAENWADYLHFLEILPDRPFDLVVSPELITGVCELPDTRAGVQNIIEEHVAVVKNASLLRPATLFVLGTAVFDDGEEMATNSVLVIKEGQIIGRTNKRTVATPGESEDFRQILDERPYTIPGTDIAILICSDLPEQNAFLTRKAWVCNQGGEVMWKGKDIRESKGFLGADARKVVVICCWGAGMDFSVSEPNAHKFYEATARHHTKRLMSKTPVEQVLMVDRVPSYNGFVTKTPINLHVVKYWK